MKMKRLIPIVVLLFLFANIPCLSQTEEVSKRTYNAKIYKNPGGSFTLDAHAGHIHYKDDQGNFWFSDYHLSDQGTYWSLTQASYRLYVNKDFGGAQFIRFDNRFEGANHSIYYEPHSIWWVNKNDPNDRIKIRDAQSVAGVLDAEQRIIKYENAFGNGIDFEVTIRRSGFQKEVVIPNQLPLNPPTPDYIPVALFKYTANGLTLKARDSQEDWDDDSYYEGEEGFTVREAVAQYKSYIHKSYIKDADGEIQKLKVFWEKRNGILWQAKVIPLNFLNNATYPIRLDTVTDYYVGAGDGYIQKSDADWDTCHDAASGSANATSTTMSIMVKEDGSYNIRRGFLPTDCTAIPDAATISAAVFYVYVAGTQNDDNDGDDWINIVGETTQADPTTLVGDDFDTCGAVNNPTEGSTRADVTGMATGQYVTWTLDATGRGWIKKSGAGADAYTRLGMREGHDCIDSTITDASENYITIRVSEYANTASDPYLKVTYTEAATYIPKVIWIKDK